ncbi:hypothetical protein QOT17_013402 [Balamuthia mandrillaris]
MAGLWRQARERLERLVYGFNYTKANESLDDAIIRTLHRSDRLAQAARQRIQQAGGVEKLRAETAPANTIEAAKQMAKAHAQFEQQTPLEEEQLRLLQEKWGKDDPLVQSFREALTQREPMEAFMARQRQLVLERYTSSPVVRLQMRLNNWATTIRSRFFPSSSSSSSPSAAASSSPSPPPSSSPSSAASSSPSPSSPSSGDK